MQFVAPLLLLWAAAPSSAFSPVARRPARRLTPALRSTADTAAASTSTSFDAFEADLDDGADEPDYFGGAEDEEAATWQENLEVLLDPTTDVARRQVLLSDLVSAREEIQESVGSALQDRKIDTLLTPTGRKLQEGTRAVVAQVATDILPNLLDAASDPDLRDRTARELPSLLPKVGRNIADAVATQAKARLEELMSDIADPTRIPERINRQADAVGREVRNVFSETPEDLTGPSYAVVSAGPDYEVREYAEYDAAATAMAQEGDSPTDYDLATTGAAFNALAAYTFGANEESRSMDMTTPVTTTSAGEMRFFLDLADGTPPPEPLASEDRPNEKGAVTIVRVPAARLAVRRFTGFATDGEVQRQKDALLSGLAADGVELDVDVGRPVPHLVFQYNPPYTVPMLRRNEICVPVVEEGAVVTREGMDVEWSKPVVAEEEEKDEGEL